MVVGSLSCMCENKYIDDRKNRKEILAIFVLILENYERGSVMVNR